MSVFGWIIIHQHYGFTFDWQLPWADYKAGFGSIDADFWLGLEKVHLLTSSRPYRLRVEVQVLSSSLWYSAEYWSFKIGDEVNEKYRLEVSGYSGDAGDSLQYEGDLKEGREEEEQQEDRCVHYSLTGFIASNVTVRRRKEEEQQEQDEQEQEQKQEQKQNQEQEQRQKEKQKTRR